MALTTQRKAIKRLREEVSGRSIAWCKSTVKRLATTKDGERWKIPTRVLDAAIQAENNPPAPRKLEGIRPLSSAKQRRIREYA